MNQRAPGHRRPLRVGNWMNATSTETNDDEPIWFWAAPARRAAAWRSGSSARGLPVRVGSRSAEPPFDWEDRATWAPALDGVGAAYISYYPDLAVPGRGRRRRRVRRLAVERGVRRLVLLSGRGEEEAEQRRARRAGLRRRPDDRALDLVRPELQRGLPARRRARRRGRAAGGGHARAVRRRRRHRRRRGRGADRGRARRPALRADRPAAADFRRSGRGDRRGRRPRDRLRPVSMDEFAAAAAAQGVPADVVGLLRYLFSEVLDGRNAHRPTACSVRSGARRRTSPTSRETPRRPASGTGWYLPNGD